MTIIARGTDQVRNVERALGGTPPRQGARKARAALQRDTAEYSKAQERAQEESARLAEPMRALLFSHVAKDDPALRQGIQNLKAAYARQSQPKLKTLTPEKYEATLAVGSISLLKVPPYDNEFTFKSKPRTIATANRVTGRYKLTAQSIGSGWETVAAGVGTWFHAPADDPQQRFAALLNYAHDWRCSASGYVAYNRCKTRLWVWGDTEQNWVLKPDSVSPAPSWDHSVSWYQDHGDADSGLVSAQAFFPARAGQFYLGWVWTRASVYSNSGLFGLAHARVHFEAAVPLVVFGSL